MTGEPSAGRPIYARVLRLRRLRPGGLLCFLYFEGAIALAVLLALAELLPWWGVLVLPVVVALMVKLNDMVSVPAVRRLPASVDRTPAPAAERLRPAVPRAREGTAGTPPASAGTGRAERPRSMSRHDAPSGESRSGRNNQGRFG
jgi:hypothetical protein